MAPKLLVFKRSEEAAVLLLNMCFGFWKMLSTRTEFHILILGIDHAGKTVRPPFLQISMPVHPATLSHFIFIFTTDIALSIVCVCCKT